VQIGLQLYTVRDELAKDFKGTLKKVAEMGYKGVGYGAMGGMAPKEFRAFLDGLGLFPACGGTGVEALEKDAKGFFATHAEVGAPTVMLGWLPETMRNSPEAWKRSAERMNEWGRAGKAAGVVFQYHNHDMEFSRDGGPHGLDILLQATDPELVKFQVDVGWVLAAGQDPVSWLKKAGKARLRTVHIKDCRTKPKLEWVEVSTGELDSKGVFGACGELGVEWGLVEQDTCAGPPLESAALSLRNILALQ
jgi:sugar phosphate isomerase/epimerase